MRKLFFLILILLIANVCYAQWGHSGFTDFGPNQSWQIWHWDPQGYYGTTASPPTVWSALEELGASVFPIAPTDTYLIEGTSDCYLIEGTSDCLLLE